MTSTRTLITIRSNLIRLYKTGDFENLLQYTKVLQKELSNYDWNAVKQAFSHKLNSRG